MSFAIATPLRLDCCRRGDGDEQFSTAAELPWIPACAGMTSSSTWRPGR
jgi:hypothetical protein